MTIQEWPIRRAHHPTTVQGMEETQELFTSWTQEVLVEDVFKLVRTSPSCLELRVETLIQEEKSFLLHDSGPGSKMRADFADAIENNTTAELDSVAGPKVKVRVSKDRYTEPDKEVEISQGTVWIQLLMPPQVQEDVLSYLRGG